MLEKREGGEEDEEGEGESPEGLLVVSPEFRLQLKPRLIFRYFYNCYVKLYDFELILIEIDYR